MLVVVGPPSKVMLPLLPVRRAGVKLCWILLQLLYDILFEVTVTSTLGRSLLPSKSNRYVPGAKGAGGAAGTGGLGGTAALGADEGVVRREYPMLPDWS